VRRGLVPKRLACSHSCDTSENWEINPAVWAQGGVVQRVRVKQKICVTQAIGHIVKTPSEWQMVDESPHALQYTEWGVEWAWTAENEWNNRMNWTAWSSARIIDFHCYALMFSYHVTSTFRGEALLCKIGWPSTSSKSSDYLNDTVRFDVSSKCPSLTT
jgi:hypothetical protein